MYFSMYFFSRFVFNLNCFAIFQTSTNVRDTLTIVTDLMHCVTIRLVPIIVGVRTVTEETDTHVHVRSS